MVGIGADEHAPACVVGDDLVEVSSGGAAQGTGPLEARALEGVILEVEADHARVGR